MGSERGHLTQQERTGYLSGTLAPAELLSADGHIQTCDYCMTVLTAEHPDPNGVSLFDLMLAEEEHLSFDQLSGHVDEELEPVESSIVKLHLEDCESCRREVAGLLEVRRELGAENAVENAFEPEAPKSFWKSCWPLIPGLGAAAIVLVLLLWPLWRGGRPSPTNELVVLPSPSVTPEVVLSSADRPDDTIEQPPAPRLRIAIKDAERTIGVDDHLEVVGLDDLPAGLRESAKKALLSGSIALGRGVEQQGQAVLMGGGGEGVPFAILQPTGEVVLQQRPRFRWRAAAGARTYTVTVFDEDFNEVASSGELIKTEWTPAADLPRGRTYRWQVSAAVGETEVRSPVRPAPDARFRIVDAAAASEIDQVRKRFPGSDLLLGIAYANAGMRKEAERSFRSLLRKNRNSEVAKKLLREVSSPDH